MSRRDWLILGCLLVAALWTGWPRLRETPVGRYLAGENPGCCGRAGGGGFRPSR